MQLTIEQQRAVQKGEPVNVTAPELGVDCILIRADVFRTLVYEDSPLTDEEKRVAFVAAGQRAGWDDAEMDIYDDLDPRRKL